MLGKGGEVGGNGLDLLGVWIILKLTLFSTTNKFINKEL